MATKHKRRVQDLPILHPDAAGIDIGSNEILVAVPAERDPESVRSFSTFTRDLYDLADWLQQCRIKSVAMESTSVYWIPLYQILETRGFEVFLVNAQHVKSVPGRKTDVSDCQWLQYLHSVGLLRSSFRPPGAICAIRSLWRHRGSLIQMAAEHVLHMQKALDQMNLQLHRVLSDITGLSGLRIVDAILAGERDPITLARLCHSRVKSSLNTVAKSLEGDYRPEHGGCQRAQRPPHRRRGPIQFLRRQDGRVEPRGDPGLVRRSPAGREMAALQGALLSAGDHGLAAGKAASAVSVQSLHEPARRRDEDDPRFLDHRPGPEDDRDV